jgi:hypothetical protein
MLNLFVGVCAANPCREIGAGWLCMPVSDNFKRKML